MFVVIVVVVFDGVGDVGVVRVVDVAVDVEASDAVAVVGFCVVGVLVFVGVVIVVWVVVVAVDVSCVVVYVGVVDVGVACVLEVVLALFYWGDPRVAII